VAKKAGIFNIVEVGFATLICCAILFNIIYFFYAGFLPRPFFHDTNDTFMDWYNAAYWVYHPHAYEIWLSVYPPFSFVFLRLFSEPSCYGATELVARTCDPIGRFVLPAFVLLNLVLVFVIYRRDNRATAIPRAIALGIGMPMLFAWERGNLIIPCFTLFILGHSRLLKAAWVRWLCVAASINFKPYLVLSLAGYLVRRQWRWVEGAVVAIVLVFMLSYALYGAGNPAVIFYNIKTFAEAPVVFSADAFAYATTYKPLLEIMQNFPIMHFVGSRPMEVLESVAPAAKSLGILGVLTCFAGAIWRPGTLTLNRLAALSMALLLTATEPGIYSEVFLFFFVFMERGRGFGQIVALTAAYILCVPFDYQVVRLAHEVTYSYLSGRAVGYNIGLTIGQFVRPTLVFVLEYGLVAASLSDILRTVLAARPQHGGPLSLPMADVSPGSPGGRP
jgi:hypothetical protein